MRVRSRVSSTGVRPVGLVTVVVPPPTVLVETKALLKRALFFVVGTDVVTWTWLLVVTVVTVRVAPVAGSVIVTVVVVLTGVVVSVPTPVAEYLRVCVSVVVVVVWVWTPFGAVSASVDLLNGCEFCSPLN